MRAALLAGCVVLVVSACTPEEQAALTSLGIDPAIVAQAASEPAIQVVLPPAVSDADDDHGATTTAPDHNVPAASASAASRTVGAVRSTRSTNFGSASRRTTTAPSPMAARIEAHTSSTSPRGTGGVPPLPASVGVDPAAAAPADQDAMARALYSERGAQPWPYCGRYL